MVAFTSNTIYNLMEKYFLFNDLKIYFLYYVIGA